MGHCGGKEKKSAFHHAICGWVMTSAENWLIYHYKTLAFWLWRQREKKTDGRMAAGDWKQKFSMNDEGSNEDIRRDGGAKWGNRETPGTKKEIIPARNCGDGTPEGRASAAGGSLWFQLRNSPISTPHPYPQLLIHFEKDLHVLWMVVEKRQLAIEPKCQAGVAKKKLQVYVASTTVKLKSEWLNWQKVVRFTVFLIVKQAQRWLASAATQCLWCTGKYLTLLLAFRSIIFHGLLT